MDEADPFAPGNLVAQGNPRDDAPGQNAYPLVNYEYAVVSIKQASADTASALKRFLLWAIAPDEDNDTRLAASHFIALPAHIWVISHDQIETIH